MELAELKKRYSDAKQAHKKAGLEWPETAQAHLEALCARDVSKKALAKAEADLINMEVTGGVESRLADEVTSAILNLMVLDFIRLNPEKIKKLASMKSMVDIRKQNIAISNQIKLDLKKALTDANV